jgi:hypothetical protein
VTSCDCGRRVWYLATQVDKISVQLGLSSKKGREMSVPGFGAESSLGPTTSTYRGKAVYVSASGGFAATLGARQNLPSQQIFPQQFGSVVAIPICPSPLLNQRICQWESCTKEGYLGLKECCSFCDFYYVPKLLMFPSGGIRCELKISSCTPMVCGPCQVPFDTGGLTGGTI